MNTIHRNSVHARHEGVDRLGPVNNHPDILVRHEDARCQWMRVPPEKLSVHLGSYLDSGVGKPSG
jgi:hypothetical protein